MPSRLVLPLAALAAALIAPVAAQATPVNTTPPSISAPVLQVGAPFSVDPGTWTGPEPLRYYFAWSRCVGPLPADCGVPNTTDDADYYVPPSGTVRVNVAVTVIDAKNSSSSLLVSSGTIAPQGPDAPGTTTLPDPRITPSGTDQVAGTVFTANRGTWSPEAASYEFRWFRCGPANSRCRYRTSTAPDAGGMTSSYASVPTDAATQLAVLVTGIGSGGTRTSRFSVSTPFILPAVPQIAAPISTPIVNTTPVAPLAKPSLQKKPKLSGTARVGRTLKLKRGTWLATTSYRYRWLRNGTAIKGATRTSYKLRRTDRGKRISCRVTATNAAGSTATRTASLRVR